MTSKRLESLQFAELRTAVVSEDLHQVREVLRSVLPWVRFLPDTDVELLVEELVATVRDAGPLGDTASVSQLLTQWRHTAEIHANPALYRVMTSRELGDFGAVPRPADGEEAATRHPRRTE